MKVKKAKKFIYGGLGFLVIFKEVEVKEVLGELVPNINHRKLQDEGFRALLNARFKLSGAHLAFIRQYMGLNQGAFAQRLGLSGHSMVSKWEKKGTAATGMTNAAEAAVRIIMHEYLNEEHVSIRTVIEILAGDLEDPRGPVSIAA
jgi:DNA-binding transcriptional regulator YiaG